jgi:hypothetical protein
MRHQPIRNFTVAPAVDASACNNSVAGLKQPEGNLRLIASWDMAGPKAGARRLAN